MITVIPKSLRGHLINCSCVIIVFGIGVLVWANNDERAPVLVLIGISGAFGGLINNYMRSSLIPTAKDDTTKVELTAFRIYMSPVIGASLAVALYMVFLGGLVSGEMFPQFSHGSEQLENPKSFMRSMLPKTNGDFAKALFWSFIAGFSERFVTTLLSGAANRGSTENGDKK